ncbi:MAG: type II toxin-antitoxin system HicB family antitoxin [Alphaproteobacteria bacterium]|nr:type II toxin-antitoxin system HicB family antitoxin [Alphaproteobacteria bacterium]
MKRRLYPVVLEGGPRGIFGAWFPDFPGCVAGGKSLEEAIAKAETALARAVDALAENLPEPTPIERIALPKGCKPLAYFIVGVDPPDPSERVNIYLPKSLLARVDQKAAQLGMSRSSFFGLAASTALDPSPTPIYLRAGLTALRASSEPRSKARKVGKLRAAKPPARK